MPESFLQSQRPECFVKIKIVSILCFGISFPAPSSNGDKYPMVGRYYPNDLSEFRVQGFRFHVPGFSLCDGVGLGPTPPKV